MKHSEYTQVFRDLAIKLKSIGHTEETPAFTRIIMSTDFLGTKFLSELVAKLDTLKMPCMVLEAYIHQYADFLDDNPMKMKAGAFYIFDKVDLHDFDAIEAALDSTEEITEDILSHFRKFYEEHPEFGSFDWNDAGGEKIGPLNGMYVGTKVNFSFDNPAGMELLYKPEKWNP